MAKGAPKPCGSPSLLAKAVWSFFLPKLCGALPSMAARPRFKPQHQSSSAALFPIPPTISYTCQHYCIFLALLGCSSKSGQVWPCGMERIISKLSHRCCNRQGLGVPSQSHPRWKSLPSLWLKAWPQLFNISKKRVKNYRYAKWPCLRLVAKLLLCRTTLNGLAPCVPFPSSDLWGWRHPIFLIFPGHPEFWTPLQIPLWGPHGCTLLQSE